MKEKLLLVILVIAIVISVAMTYKRSFMWKNFEVVNSEETSNDTEPDLLMDDASTEVLMGP